VKKIVSAIMHMLRRKKKKIDKKNILPVVSIVALDPHENNVSDLLEK